MSGLGFVISVYTVAVLYAGFWLGARYNTIANMKDRFLNWLASLAKK